jgi:pimeloyl-ACP methyl ester carboxylesterase/DNA-binding winged helix-turn-helix (wHTH) protein
MCPYRFLDFCLGCRSNKSGPRLGSGKLKYSFEDFVLDTDQRELRRGHQYIAIQPQVFDLLEFMIRNRERVVSKDDLIAAIWGGRIVSESALTTRINAARTAIGDSGEDQRLIRTIPRKGVRFVGVVQEEHPRPPRAVALPSGAAKTEVYAVDIGPRGGPGSSVLATANLKQEIKYCRTADGVRLAYAKVGTGPPLMRSAHWLGHLEYDWELPIFRHQLLGLAKEFTLTRYDARGNGLSDWDVGEISLDAWVSDLETVVDAVGIERFPLLGFSQGCAVSIAFAVRHPERVSHLVLYGGFAVGRLKRPNMSDADRERIAAMATLIKVGWGADDPTFRQIFTSTKEDADAFNELQRKSASPACAARYFETVNNFDIRGLLPRVTAPTLVMHVRDDTVPIELGREIAAEIPDARFVPLPGRNHIPLEHDPGMPRFFEEIQSFLKGA